MKRTLSILLVLLLLLSTGALASSSSIGVIGGADGPTAIFVSGDSLLTRLLEAIFRFFIALFGR